MLFGRLSGALVVLLISVLVPASLGWSPVRADGDPEQRLSAARAELDRIAEELDGAEDDAKDAEAALELATQRLAAIEDVVNEVAAQVEAQRVVVRDAEQRLERVEAEQVAVEATFSDRVARLYKQGPELTFETLLGAEGAEEAIARTQLLERVVAGDQVDLERLDAVAVAVDAQRELVTAAQEELEAQLAEQEELRAQADDLRASRALSAADARARAEELAAERDELEAEEEGLVALLERQQAEERRRAEAAAAAAESASSSSSSSPSSGSSSSSSSSSSGGSSAAAAPSGGYAWPMCARVTSEYGPRWGRMHRGIDLGAPVGSAIRAIRGGTVIFAGWQGGYGQTTLIDHGNGVVSLYAHQSRFAVSQGARVSQGQVIGYVGMTGSTTGPHLHLETRVGGSAVNPRQYLSGSPC